MRQNERGWTLLSIFFKIKYNPIWNEWSSYNIACIGFKMNKNQRISRMNRGLHYLHSFCQFPQSMMT